MHSRALPPRTRTPRRWLNRIATILFFLVVLAGLSYLARRTLLLNIARIVLSHDSALMAQEKADGVAIVFAQTPSVWITPMKNQMNDIWDPIKANGINYYLFARPRTWLTSYSERSNPFSPYYQAWAGAYVIKQRDGSLPTDLESLAWQVTALDQRSWLSAMGDSKPMAEASKASIVGNISIDGHNLPLWHGTMRSHSDLSAHPAGPLATLIGMPPGSLWPSGLDSFHEVLLDGYFACWVDAQRGVSIVVYAVAATYTGQPVSRDHANINNELLTLMKSARLQALH